MIDLSTLSRARLCARVVKLEALGALSSLVSRALADRLVSVERERDALTAVLQQQVVEATDLRRRLAELAPEVEVPYAPDPEVFHGPDLAPTLDEIRAHATAYPYRPEEEPGDVRLGLWLVRSEWDGVALVALGADGGQRYCLALDAVRGEVRCAIEVLWRSAIEWRPLTRRGYPLDRGLR